MNNDKNKAKFTPGPWRASKTLGGYYLIQGKNDVGSQSLATTDKYYSEANAHLIATAPEMFELLLEVNAYFESEGQEYQQSRQVLWDEIISVLNKARGSHGKQRRKDNG